MNADDNMQGVSSKTDSYIELAVTALLFSIPSFLTYARYLAYLPLSLNETDRWMIISAVAIAFLISILGRGLDTARRFLQIGIGTSLVWCMLSYFALSNQLLEIYYLITGTAVVINIHLLPVYVLLHARGSGSDCSWRIILPLIVILILLDLTPLVYYFSSPQYAASFSAIWLLATLVSGILAAWRIFMQINNNTCDANQNRSHL